MWNHDEFDFCNSSLVSLAEKIKRSIHNNNKEKYIGKVITVDGPQPGVKDGSWRGSFFLVVNVMDDGRLLVSTLLEMLQGIEEYYVNPWLKTEFFIDCNIFKVRVVNAAEVIDKLKPSLTTYDDMARRRGLAKGKKMLDPNDICLLNCPARKTISHSG